MKRTDRGDGRRTLRLARETLRVLGSDELAQVQGGVVLIAVPKVSRCCTTQLP